MRLAPAQDFALGVGGQVLGVADADGNLPGGEQRRHEDVIDSPDYQHNARRFGAQALEQGGQQCELDVIGQADAEDRGTGRRVELRGAADRRRDGVECRGEQGEDFRRSGGGLHAAPGAHEQWIIEQAAQPRQCSADRRLTEKQLFRRTRDAALMHQGLENDEQIEVDATQVVAIHAEYLGPFVG